MIAPPLPPDEPRWLQALYRLCLLDTPGEFPPEQRQHLADMAAWAELPEWQEAAVAR